MTRDFRAGGAQWAVEGHAGWAHEFRDPVPVSARLSGDPLDVPFAVVGPAVPRDSAVLGAGVAAQIRRELRLYVDFSADVSHRQRNHVLGAGLRYQG